MSSLFENAFALPGQGGPQVPTARPTQNTDPCDFQALGSQGKNGLGRGWRIQPAVCGGARAGNGGATSGLLKDEKGGKRGQISQSGKLMVCWLFNPLMR